MSSTIAFREVLRQPFALMGIVNVTPDSFYDGGKHDTIESAYAHGIKLIEEGADILDIGGASSRPGAKPITPEEECERIVPVVQRLKKAFHGPISVDTTWSYVAQRAIDAGAECVNDISAGRFDSQLATVVAASGCSIVLMHSRGTPQTMQNAAVYNDVTAEVIDELMESVHQFKAAGVDDKNIILDPGIGFAKTSQQNIVLLRELQKIADLGYPVLMGTSRKAFIGHITGKPVEQRLYGTLASVASSFLRGATVFRVHDVAETRDFLRVLNTIEYEKNA